MSELGSLKRVCLALFILSGGCAQNAILELQVHLPANPTVEPLFAVVEVRAASTSDAIADFADRWVGSAVRAVQLMDVQMWHCVSVESLDPSLSALVRVRFCRSEDCSTLADDNAPAQLYSLETPFYVGSRTYSRIEIESVPQCMVGEPCAVGVCIGGRCACTVDADCGGDFVCAPGGGCVELIDRCEIEGCIRGPMSATYCSMEGGHFCERSPDVLRDETFMCSSR